MLTPDQQMLMQALAAPEQAQAQPEPNQLLAMMAKKDSTDTSRGMGNVAPELPGGGLKPPTVSQPSPFPEGYHDKIPVDMRLKGQGFSHPGYRWEVYDPKTDKVLGEYTNSRRAGTRVDKLDNEYGAYRYRKRPVRAGAVTDEESKILQELGITLP